MNISRVGTAVKNTVNKVGANLYANRMLNAERILNGREIVDGNKKILIEAFKDSFLRDGTARLRTYANLSVGALAATVLSVSAYKLISNEIKGNEKK